MIEETGCGRSTLINNIVGQTVVKAKFSFCSVTVETVQVAVRMKIHSQTYDISFIEPSARFWKYDHMSTAKTVAPLKEAISERFTSGVNLILILVNLEDRIRLDMFKILQSEFKPAFWKASVLIFTHCDKLYEREVEERIINFKTNKVTKAIAERFQDKMITVGFPSLDYFSEQDKERIADKMKIDVNKLHDIITSAELIMSPKQIA